MNFRSIYTLVVEQAVLAFSFVDLIIALRSEFRIAAREVKSYLNKYFCSGMESKTQMRLLKPPGVKKSTWKLIERTWHEAGFSFQLFKSSY